MLYGPDRIPELVGKPGSTIKVISGGCGDCPLAGAGCGACPSKSAESNIIVFSKNKPFSGTETTITGMSSLNFKDKKPYPSGGGFPARTESFNNTCSKCKKSTLSCQCKKIFEAA